MTEDLARADGTASSPAPDRAQPKAARIRQAAGIYGLIVTAAVIASAGGQLRTLPLALSVIVTVVVYWLAEEYAELGAHASGGHLPSWAHIRAALALKWPMVTASYVPLLVLVVVRVCGASSTTAAFVALATAVVLLSYYGWSAGRAAGLGALGVTVMTAIAGGLGILMVVLKIVISHLH